MEHRTPQPAPPGAADDVTQLLDAAATAALRAPSIFNTQPWKWRVHDGVLDLSVDPDRRLRAVDPDSRMLTVSCGVALHHALVALAAHGRDADVAVLPDAGHPDLLARVVPTELRDPTPAERRMYQALLGRRTDRRPFGTDPVTDRQVELLEEAAAGTGAHVHVIQPSQVATIRVAASTAASIETADPDYRAELGRWTRRDPVDRDGVPAATTVPDSIRRVPLRRFRLAGGDELGPGGGFDDGTRYLVLAADDDDRVAWFRTGRAMSAVLLTAHDLDLGASPMSDLAEVSTTRMALRRMLDLRCHPHMVIRVGVPTAGRSVPPTPRRLHDSVVTATPPATPGG